MGNKIGFCFLFFSFISAFLYLYFSLSFSFSLSFFFLFPPQSGNKQTRSCVGEHTHTRLLFPFAQPPTSPKPRPPHALSYYLDYHLLLYLTAAHVAQNHGSWRPCSPVRVQKARLHQNTTPISTLARRLPPSNLNMWEERVRPQKPQLSPLSAP